MGRKEECSGVDEGRTKGAKIVSVDIRSRSRGGFGRANESDTDFLPFDMDVGSSSSPMVPNAERGDVEVDSTGVSALLIRDVGGSGPPRFRVPPP